MRSRQPSRFVNRPIGYSCFRPIKTEKKGGSVSLIQDEAVPGLPLLLCEQANEAGRVLEAVFVSDFSKLYRGCVRYILS
jgi:hypothetical protein